MPVSRYFHFLLALFGLCLLCVLLGLSAAPARAALALDAEPRFESVGVGSIPRGVVAALAQDRAGFLWIATGDGLVRHDAYRFRPQERVSKIGPARNLGWLRALLSARDGRLWIGTESDGLAVYDPATEQVSLVSSQAQEPTDSAAVVWPTIRALAEDVDGAIWVATLGAGLDRFDPGSGSFTHYRASGQPGSLSDDRVHALLIDRQGTLWVGTWSGLSRRLQDRSDFEAVFAQTATGTAPRPGSLDGQKVQALFEASDGRIWVGTQQGGLALLDPLTAQGQLLPADAKPGGGRSAVNSFVETPDGLARQVWVGHAAGIDVHDSTTAKLLQQLRHDPLNPTGLAGDEVTHLLADRAGWIWVGGFGLGLQRHNPANRSIWVRGPDASPATRHETAFRKADVRSLLQLDNGDIWAAQHKGGVAVLDPQLRVIATLPLPPASSGGRTAAASQQVSRVIAMAQMTATGAGHIWLAAPDALLQFDRQRRLLHKLPHRLGPLRHLLAGSEGSLWVGSDDGLYRLRPKAAVLQRVALTSGQAHFGEIYSMAQGPDEALWVGGRNGLFRIAPGGSTLQPVLARAGAGLGNPAVLGLLFDRRQTLWLDTSVKGLHRMSAWDGSQASFERISERHGINHRPFGVNMLEDGRGRIWTQLNVYDPATDKLDELTPTDGIDIGTPWFFAYTKTLDGRLLFGGSKGVAVVSPDTFDMPVHAPPLVAAELRINGERESAGQLQQGLQLTPEQRSFSLEFAALDYSNPSRSSYAYRLEGFDPAWISTGAELRVAAYSNLSPGDYLLRVRASNRSGVASQQELAIPIRVLPAWWQQWWFRLLLLGALLLSAYLLLQLRTRQLRARQLWLEGQVSQRTAELEESSLTDPLTGLRNRRFLAQHIEADVALTLRRHEGQKRAAPPDESDLVFFLLDIDHFKQVNDEFGHAAGDAVLMQVRRRLQQVFRESDYLVRWGGEEFLIVARESTRTHAPELAARACAALAEQPFVLPDGRLLHKTCSVGFACFPLATAAPAALDWAATVNIADAALYAAKRAGRNGWLGILGARGESVAALSAWSHKPLADWLASGELQSAASGESMA
jgi:diguanylate cyclase (GGDEF)-like protein